MVLLWLIIGLVAIIIALYAMLIVFVIFHDVDSERVCRNCRDYDSDLEYCWQDGIHRPATCKACALFTKCNKSE